MTPGWLDGYVSSRPEPLSRGKRLALRRYAPGALRLIDLEDGDAADLAAWLEAQRAAQEAAKPRRRRRS